MKHYTHKKKSSTKKKLRSIRKQNAGKYIYYPKENIIQFMPYSYPSNQHLGNQFGGNPLLSSQCGYFNPNMLTRQFDCNQPFWDVKCT